MKKPFSIYSTWGLQDELGDRVELSEALARKALEGLRRWRSEFGIQQDIFALDAFWFDTQKGYRHFKKPHWPNGFEPLVADIRALGMQPGLWYSVNGASLTVPAWQASLSSDGRHYSLVDGPYADELHAALLYAAEQWHVRLFKFDFAGFFTAAAGVTRAPEETYRLSVARFTAMLRDLRSRYPEVWTISHCGFARNHGLSTPATPELLATDPAWLEVMDATFSGDPQPWDVPQTTLTRNLDLFQDHQVWKMHVEGFPLHRIEDHGIIVGTTNTCFYRGRAGFRRSHLAQLARGGGRDMFYGDPTLLTDADLAYLEKARGLFFDACRRNLTTRFVGGEPGVAPWHGFITGGGARGLAYVVNPNPYPQTLALSVPCLADARILFHDGKDRPSLQTQPDQLAVALGPEQMALIGMGDYSDAPYELGAELDADLPRDMRLLPLQFQVQADGRWVAELSEALPADSVLHVRVEVRDRAPTGIWSQPHRFGHQNTHDSTDMTPVTHASVLIRAVKDGQILTPTACVPDVPVWSGIAWVAASFRAAAPLRIEIEQRFPEPRRLRATAYAIR
jgi:hypothetical protein